MSTAFCKFVETAGVTMLGVIPSMVRQWKHKDMTKVTQFEYFDILINMCVFTHYRIVIGVRFDALVQLAKPLPMMNIIG